MLGHSYLLINIIKVYKGKDKITEEHLEPFLINDHVDKWIVFSWIESFAVFEFLESDFVYGLDHSERMVFLIAIFNNKIHAISFFLFNFKHLC